MKKCSAVPPSTAGISSSIWRPIEAELLIVIGPDPLGRVDDTLFQGRIDYRRPRSACGMVPSLERGFAGPATMRNLRPLRSSTVLISFRNQPPIWGAGVAAGDAVQFVLPAELIEHVLAAVVLNHRVLLARIQPERNGAIQREGRVLADEVIGRGVTHLDRGVAHRIDRLQRRDDLATGERLNLEFIVGGFRDVFRIVSDALKGTSSDFGQLVVQRHFSSGIELRDGGVRATAVDTASPAPAVFRNSRRS